jgi:large subunit ribosomal protein L13
MANFKKTTKSKSVESALKDKKWFIVDASGIVLGRLATEVAEIIRGKHKVDFTPHIDCGDGVIVINASKLVITGNKSEDKLYHKYTGFIGHMKTKTAGEILESNPAKLIEFAVVGMLPKGALGQNMKKKLKIYDGAEHPHTSQVPTEYKFKYTAARKSAA